MKYVGVCFGCDPDHALMGKDNILGNGKSQTVAVLIAAGFIDTIKS